MQVVFGLALLGVCVILVRGIVRSLDRMTAVGPITPTAVVDTRALRACADDLGRLERKISAGAMTFLDARPKQTPSPSWEAFADQSERERLTIVRRCRLDETSDDLVVTELADAAASVEAVLRSYGILHGRFREEGLLHSQEVQAAIKRAQAALKTR